MRIEAHAFAGLGGFLFDRGTRSLDKLMDDLSTVWDCNHWQHGQWQKALAGIIARQKIHNDNPMVILISHSYGALRCQQIAEALNGKSISVDYIGCIDATALPRGHAPMIVPANVKKVDEFWATSGFPAGARRRDPTGNKGGRYIYPAHWKGKKTLTIVPGGHISCASDSVTRDKIMASVKELVA